MATIGHALRQVKEQLDRFVTTEQIEQICRDHQHTWRKRLLDPATTIHLCLLQLLAKLAMETLRHASKIPASAQALCAAKMRLPLAVWMDVVKRVCPAVDAQPSWRGMSVYLADGMGLLTEDTEELADAFGKARNGRGTGHGRPNPKLLAVLDLAGGFVHRVIALPWSRQERVCLSRLFAACGAGSLLLGDRGLVGFAHVALMLGAGVQGCFRLPRWLVVRGHGKANHRRLRRLGKQDQLVIWSKPDGRVGWMSKPRWAQLPGQLTLRQVAFRTCRPGFRTRWAWVVTTLTDPQRYPAEAIVELYGKRWQVEVYFRDLKATLGLRGLCSRTVAGARKELLAFVILYNLVRQVIAAAAASQGVPPDRISFTDAMNWLLWSEPGEELPELTVNPVRTRPAHPRALKHGHQKYARMAKPREQLTKPACEAKL